MIEPLIRFLAARDDLTQDEIDSLRSINGIEKSFERGAEIVPAHSFPDHACLLLSGVAARELAKRDGSRQLSALHFSGEIIDAAALVKKQIDHAIVAVTPAKVALLPHAQLRPILDASPHLTRLLWLAVSIDSSIQRAWIAAMGRSSATVKLGHLLCEIYLRSQLIGEADGYRFQLPLTQSQLADCIGVSEVQMNRSLRDLRERGLATMSQSEVTIHAWERLTRFTGFDERYLNLVKTSR